MDEIRFSFFVGAPLAAESLDARLADAMINLCSSDEEDEPVEQIVASRYFGADIDDSDDAPHAAADADSDATVDDSDVEEITPPAAAGSSTAPPTAAFPPPAAAGGSAAPPTSAFPPPTAAGSSAAPAGSSAAPPASGFFSSLLEEHGGLVRTRRPFEPMAHQLDAAAFCSSRPSVYSLVHEPGLGKTCSTMLIYAALEAQARREGRACGRLLISSPAAVLQHWARTTTEYLRVRSREVLCTSKAGDVTAAALRNAKVIILTRDCVTNIFKRCHAWVEEHHEVSMPNGGRRWAGAAPASVSSQVQL